MTVQNIIPMLPSDDLARDVAVWSALLGAPPTFVDGDRWAQFDIAGKRLALAGTDQVADKAGVMLKVDDLAAAADRARAAGLRVGEEQAGAHERRCLVLDGQGSPIVLYAPL